MRNNIAEYTNTISIKFDNTKALLSNLNQLGFHENINYGLVSESEKENLSQYDYLESIGKLEYPFNELLSHSSKYDVRIFEIETVSKDVIKSLNDADEFESHEDSSEDCRSLAYEKSLKDFENLRIAQALGINTPRFYSKGLDACLILSEIRVIINTKYKVGMVNLTFLSYDLDISKIEDGHYLCCYSMLLLNSSVIKDIVINILNKEAMRLYQQEQKDSPIEDSEPDFEKNIKAQKPIIFTDEEFNNAIQAIKSEYNGLDTYISSQKELIKEYQAKGITLSTNLICDSMDYVSHITISLSFSIIGLLEAIPCSNRTLYAGDFKAFRKSTLTKILSVSPNVSYSSIARDFISDKGCTDTVFYGIDSSLFYIDEDSVTDSSIGKADAAMVMNFRNKELRRVAPGFSKLKNDIYYNRKSNTYAVATDYTNMQKLDYSYIYSNMMYISLIAAAFRSKLIKMQNSYDSEEPSSRKIIKYIKELRKTNLDCISWQILLNTEFSDSAEEINDLLSSYSKVLKLQSEFENVNSLYSQYSESASNLFELKHLKNDIWVNRILNIVAILGLTSFTKDLADLFFSAYIIRDPNPESNWWLLGFHLLILLFISVLLIIFVPKILVWLYGTSRKIFRKIAERFHK